MININFKTILVFAIIAISFSSCNKGNNNENISTPGILKIKLTDAPFPTDLVAEANITIKKIEIRRTNQNEASDSLPPFITLSEEEMSFNLLDLTNGVTASLVDLEIAAGTYDLIRMYVSKADVILTDGSGYDLKVPSGAKSGMKIFIKPGIQVGGGLTSELLLDFDVSKSFKPRGNPNNPSDIRGFIFTPVVKASNLSTTGTLSGIVNNTKGAAIDGVQVAVIASDTVYTTSFTNESGQYTILGIDAGTYSVNYEFEGYEALTKENVEIVAGNETTVNTVLAEI